MDQELIAYLDTRFRETNQQIISLREEIGGLREGFGDLREETTQQATSLGEEIGSLRKETTQQIAGVREETRQEIRQVYVVIEGLRHDIQTVAEGVTGFSERLDAFRTEVAQEFKDVRSLIHLSYKDLDRRIRRSDEDTDGLKIGTPG